MIDLIRMSKEETMETLNQYLESTKFILDKLYGMSKEIGLDAHSEIWLPLSVILFRVESFKRFQKVWRSFHNSEILKIMEEMAEEAECETSQERPETTQVKSS